MKLHGTWFFSPRPYGGREFRVEVYEFLEQGTFGNWIHEKQSDGTFRLIRGSSPQATIGESLTIAEEDVQRMLAS
jgi:hypothetical protein